MGYFSEMILGTHVSHASFLTDILLIHTKDYNQKPFSHDAEKTLKAWERMSEEAWDNGASLSHDQLSWVPREIFH
jgi:hypothetical protein